MRNFTAERFYTEARELDRQAAHLRRTGERDEAETLAALAVRKRATAENYTRMTKQGAKS